MTETEGYLLGWLVQLRETVDLGNGRTIPSRIEQVLEHPEWNSPTDQLIRHALEIEAREYGTL